MYIPCIYVQKFIIVIIDKKRVCTSILVVVAQCLILQL